MSGLLVFGMTGCSGTQYLQAAQGGSAQPFFWPPLHLTEVQPIVGLRVLCDVHVASCLWPFGCLLEAFSGHLLGDGPIPDSHITLARCTLRSPGGVMKVQ